MAIKTLNLFQYDLQPYYKITVKDAAGSLIDLTSAAIVCTMKSDDGTVKINRQSTGIVIANQTTNKGEFEYRWQSTDTNTVGAYSIEFEITPTSGGKFTLPSLDQGAAGVVIHRGLDGQ